MSDEKYRCGTSDLLPVGASMPMWPTREIAYAFAHYLPDSLLSKADQEAITRDNWSLVRTVCGLTAVRTDDVRDAHIVYTIGRGMRSGLDGKGGTLAQAWLPVGVGPQYRNGGRVGAGLVMFDLDDAFTNQKPYGRRIGYQPVNFHEGCGHGLGLSHNPAGDSIMAATYDPDETGPGAYEIAELRRRYGEPQAPSQPPPVPKADTVEVVVRLGGDDKRKFRGTLEPVT